MIRVQALQQVYDVAAEYLLGLMNNPVDRRVFKFGRHWDDYYAIHSFSFGICISPTAKIALTFSEDEGDMVPFDLEDDETTAGELIESIGKFENLEYFRNKLGPSDLIDEVDLQSLLRDLEEVYAEENPSMIPMKLIHAAKRHYLRWDRPCMTKVLLGEEEEPQPVVTEEKEEPEVNESNSIQDLINTLKNNLGGLDVSIGDMAEQITKFWDEPVGEEVLKPFGTQAPDPFAGKEVDKSDDFLFHDLLGHYVTFVTEDNSPTLQLGTVISKNVVYDRESPNGRTVYAIEVMKGFNASVHYVTNLQKAVVCQGEYIHYSDFNRIVQDMMQRLDL